MSAPPDQSPCRQTGLLLYSFVFLVSNAYGLVSVMQSDPELLSRTEGEVQQLAQEMDKLRLATQSK